MPPVAAVAVGTACYNASKPLGPLKLAPFKLSTRPLNAIYMTGFDSFVDFLQQLVLLVGMTVCKSGIIDHCLVDN